MKALRGYCANDVSQSATDTLKPEWLRVAYGAWLWSDDVEKTVKWVPDLSEPHELVDHDNLLKVMAHPNYDHWWLLMNEPDLDPAWQNPNDVMGYLGEYGSLLLALDPEAKLAIAAGTFQNPMYAPNSWFQKLWKRLKGADKKEFRQHICALHTHLYPNVAAGLHIYEYAHKCRVWMDENNLATRELWFTEIGRTKANPDPRYTPTNIQAQLSKAGVARWAYYIEKDRDGYEALIDANGALLPQGESFQMLTERE